MASKLSIILRFLCATRFLVIACLSAIVIMQPDVETLGFLVGLSAAGLIAKLLKKLINHERPVIQAMKREATDHSSATSKRRKSIDPIKQFDLFLYDAHLLGPGMPSSHATSLSFIAIYASIAICQSKPPDKLIEQSTPLLTQYFHAIMDQSFSKLLSLLTLNAVLAFMCLRRVTSSLHSWPQVLVGMVLGAIVSVIHSFAIMPEIRASRAGHRMFVGNGRCTSDDLLAGVMLVLSLLAVFAVLFDRHMQHFIKHIIRKAMQKQSSSTVNDSQSIR